MEQVRVTRERLIDAGEIEDGDFFDYYYEYDVISFAEDGGCTVVARSYVGEPEEAHLLYLLDDDGRHRELEAEHLDLPLVRAAIASLQHAGQTVEWLGPGGYLSVPAPTRPRVGHLRWRLNYLRSTARLRLGP